MRRRAIARTVVYAGAAMLAVSLFFKPPLVERAYAEKQQSAEVKLSPKEKKKLLKNFDKAVEKGDAEKVKELMDHGGKLITKERKTTALMAASKMGYLDVIKLLVNADADVSAFDMNSYKTREMGWTPLIHAAVNDQLEVVKYFIEELGIDVDQRSATGCTALMNAAYFIKKDLDKNMAVIEYLISKGADVNAVSDNGTTALMGAATDGRLEVGAKLVQNGARVMVRSTAYGDTALYRAVERDRYDFVGFLLLVGADINVQDDFGVSPLIKAAGNGSINSVKMLVAKGADVNLKDDEGRTALMYAVRGADPKIENLSEQELESIGETQKKHYELKKQYRKESIKIINILLSSPKLDVNAKDKSGKTALDYADDTEIREILKKYKKGAA